VVNLTSAFVAGHPSGLQAETLTVLSICATLNANMPNVTQCDFWWTASRALHWRGTPT